MTQKDLDTKDHFHNLRGYESKPGVTLRQLLAKPLTYGKRPWDLPSFRQWKYHLFQECHPQRTEN